MLLGAVASRNPIGIVATGGTIADATISGLRYRIHTFTSNGNFVFSHGAESTLFDILLVGGGGSGGTGSSTTGGGGGGGGQVLLTTGVTRTHGSHAVAVGGGGAAQTGGLCRSRDRRSRRSRPRGCRSRRGTARRWLRRCHRSRRNR